MPDIISERGLEEGRLWAVGLTSRNSERMWVMDSWVERCVEWLSCEKGILRRGVVCRLVPPCLR